MSENTREIVLDTLLSLEREAEYSHKLIKAVLDKYDYLDSRDKAFIKRVTEGTIERKIELDYYLNHFSSVPVKKMKPLIRCLLRLSVYQLLYMDAVPDSSVCNEACKLAAKRKFVNLKGFVNGVLRNISNEKQHLPLPDAQKDPEAYFSVKYSMPQWLIHMWMDEYGKEITATLLEGLLRIHPISLRFSTRLSEKEREGYVEKIKALGVQLHRTAYLPYVYTAEGTKNLSLLPGFAEGAFTVQDVSSALAVEAAGISEKDFVMDICAAPGGKTLLAAEKGAKVLARDASQGKVDLIEENLGRMRISNVTAQVFDALEPDESMFEKADVLLMDLPCSGLGVMGKKRDIKYNASLEGLASIIELQKKIIENSWRYVKPGGVLLYSTCTINKRENQEMVHYITEHFPFEPEDLTPYLPDVLTEQSKTLQKKICGEGKQSVWETDKEASCCIQLLPGYMEADGFFIARLRRKTKQHMTSKAEIKSMTLEELTKEITVKFSEPAFRAKQIYEWMHVKLAAGFEDMTNLPKSLREKCMEAYRYTALKCIQVQESEIDGTKKFLFALSDGNVVESVWMKYRHGNSVCISSQVGCRMGCKFCASTLDGLERNLSAAEMLEQVYAITRLTKERVSNVVVMGTGEPLDNYDNLLRYLKLLTDEYGLHISQRNVTVSTCGLAPMMRKLAEEKLQITLALSLHAATDEKRRALMPIANKYSIEELMEACRYYFEKTGRRITFEYSLVGGVNDTREDAERLIALAKPLCCHVNLIPVNPIKERNYVQSDSESILAFKNKLEKKKINVTIRREMGRDIDGACGQLRRRHMQKNPLQEEE